MMNVSGKVSLMLVASMLLAFALTSCDEDEDEKVIDQEQALFVDCCPNGNHPHMIDLGLPSGVKWACCNLGAKWPVGFGEYYHWDYQHDLAKEVLGSKEYEVPTVDDFRELQDNCTWEPYLIGDTIPGMLFTGPNNNYIVLPSGGCGSWEDDGTFWTYNKGSGFYWTSTISGELDDNPYQMCVENNTAYWDIDLLKYFYISKSELENDGGAFYFTDRSAYNTLMTVRAITRYK